jgi:hypothetical protein
MKSDWEEVHQPYLFMAEGWHQGEDGVWRVTQRGLRDRAFLSGRSPDMRRHFRPPLTPDDEIGLRGVKGREAHHLPSVAICPFCGTPQRLDPGVLSVDPFAWDGGPAHTYAPTEERQD